MSSFLDEASMTPLILLLINALKGKTLREKKTRNCCIREEMGKEKRKVRKRSNFLFSGG
jgi:hypothetical protein